VKEKATDLDLWEAIKMDNEQAFASLFNRYWSKLYSTAYSYTRDKEVCADIVHDIFLSLWTKRAELEIQSFTAYLTSATRYKVYKHLSASKSSIIDYKEEPEVFETASLVNDAENKLNRQDFETEIDNYLVDLPRRCREIFIMSRRLHLSNDEIAEKLGISKRTVENQITHALKHLRVSLKDLSVMLLLIESISRMK